MILLIFSVSLVALELILWNDERNHRKTLRHRPAPAAFPTEQSAIGAARRTSQPMDIPATDSMISLAKALQTERGAVPAPAEVPQSVMAPPK